MDNKSITFPYNFRSKAALNAGVLIWQTVPPVLIVFGTVGNVLSMIVLTRGTLKHLVSSTYLLSLSVVDLLVLYIGLLRQWLRYLVGFDIRTAANWICKMHSCLQYIVLDVSVWLLTMFTIERLIPTMSPFSNRIICTKQRARVIVCSVCVVVIVWNSHIIYGMELRPTRGENGSQVYTCDPHTGKCIRRFAGIYAYCRYFIDRKW